MQLMFLTVVVNFWLLTVVVLPTTTTAQPVATAPPQPVCDGVYSVVALGKAIRNAPKVGKDGPVTVVTICADLILEPTTKFYASEKNLHLVCGKKPSIPGEIVPRCTIDAQYHQSEIFISLRGAKLSFERIQFINARGTNSGYIRVNSTDVVLKECSFINNQCHSGCGITLAASSLHLIGTDTKSPLSSGPMLFEENNSTGLGGAIFAFDSSITSSIEGKGKKAIIFQNNHADVNGGAIWTDSRGRNFQIQRTTFRSNSAGTVLNPGIENSGNGGAIMGFFTDRENFLLKNSVFDKNTVLGGGGGAINLFNTLPLVFEKCIFSNNKATSAPTTYQPYRRTGGAIHMRGEPVTLKKCLFKNNSNNNVRSNIFSFAAITCENTTLCGDYGIDDIYGMAITNCRQEQFLGLPGIGKCPA